ncbi:MAG TPA: hypothetical protein VHA74_02950 [Candidatus Dojkabacteria bacterium]|nr:hypothetical protein [Candidatus Dojkabacteria bacterium]
MDSAKAEYQLTIYQFTITNYEEVYDKDSTFITTLEATLVKKGLMPTKIDFPSKVLIVIVQDPNTTLDSAKEILESFGLAVAQAITYKEESNKVTVNETN